MLTDDALAAADGIAHGFFTRQGGVSKGVYDSLNCGLGSGDAPDRVRENRGRATARLGHDESALATAYQVHSATAVVVERPWPAADRPQADGLATRTPGVALGILTADCAPVLFADGAAGVIGAAHGGWRGARSGIVEATVAAMEGLGATRSAIRAAVGPCIGAASYEVGPEFRAAFVGDDAANEDLFQPSSRAEHYLFDLARYVSRRLAAMDLAAVEVVDRDTFAEPETFFSFRRTTLAGGGDYGRGLSAIALPL